jgi:hypothetical protein
MKKLIAAIAAAFMLTLGLVAISEAPATAACPYSACFNTITTVSAPARVHNRRSVPIRVTVSAPGNVLPGGYVTVTVSKGAVVKFSSTQSYVGGILTFTTQGFRHGTFSVTAVYTPADPRFNGSSAATSFTIKEKKHHHHHHHN